MSVPSQHVMEVECSFSGLTALTRQLDGSGTRIERLQAPPEARLPFCRPVPRPWRRGCCCWQVEELRSTQASVELEDVTKASRLSA